MQPTLEDLRKERFLIVNADDFGMCKAANDAVAHLLREELISSATLMTPCPWAPDAASLSRAHPEWDIGVHWTLTSEWGGYKWGPAAHGANVGSLVDGLGYFHAQSETVERNADPEQIRVELRSQVERFERLGLKPTHADNHMGSMYGLHTGRDFLLIALELCAEYGLPFRLPRRAAANPDVPEALRALAARAVAAADRLGVAIIDELENPPYGKQPGETYDDVKNDFARRLSGLGPGVTELIIHPALPTEELQAITPDWEKRYWDFQLFGDPDIRGVLRSEGIRMIGWRTLQSVQRRGI
ncbi:polysaccharide deacetylase family protein [Paenibacillus alkalitolerans]|uniref:polysaccharide deacetylase family protein n=1 Tax=Paenibacillus alkalitolerans TaxID=2799335 RepID=UPI0018F38555|nr:polysaccharide deacetylase family protein [Paenibacillus alkalitolerans]